MGGEDLGDERGEIMMRIYFMKKNIFFKKELASLE